MKQYIVVKYIYELYQGIQTRNINEPWSQAAVNVLLQFALMFLLLF